jgi:hypothetical protein
MRVGTYLGVPCIIESTISLKELTKYIDEWIFK